MIDIIDHDSAISGSYMTLEQIVSLVTIVDIGSFRGASEKLNKAQSAISYAIRNLEEELGVSLFDRTSYRPKLTEAGRVMFYQAKKIIEETNHFEELGNTLGEGVEPLINLAVSAPFPIQTIIPCFSDFQQVRKRTRLKLSVEVLGALDKLKAEEADIAITELRELNDPDLEYSEILDMQMIPVAQKKHSLVTSKEEVGPRELLKHPHIVLRSTTGPKAESSAGVLAGALTWSVSDFSTKKDLLLGGVGWGLMPKHLIEQELKNNELKIIKTSVYKRVVVKFFLVKLRSKLFGPARKDLWNRVLNQCDIIGKSPSRDA